MQTVQDVATFVEQRPHLMALLRAVATLSIDDCWIGAGIIRNAVWDRLHNYPVELASGSDVDVVYFDSSNVNAESDLILERRLSKERTGFPWSVRNQAGMHERNGDAPYRNCEDAIRSWPETATVVAARLGNERVQILAPHGIDDLVHMIIRPTPALRTKMSVYERRLASKNWARRWPHLVFL
jgi:hypothetical protein